eukprot:TRINITY_DN6731_c0_g1_i3.p1 TRINITY_DN6731_c0_g1~~TRINITY_DN6731_c0_g1_i3.p1  ORF type:complete len:218 (+),score=58.48 TRINITY_DN6731_c0_g1_i3:120-773(+)
MWSFFFFFFQAEDGIRDAQESRGLGDVYKRQMRDYPTSSTNNNNTKKKRYGDNHDDDEDNDGCSMERPSTAIGIVPNPHGTPTPTPLPIVTTTTPIHVDHERIAIDNNDDSNIHQSRHHHQDCGGHVVGDDLNGGSYERAAYHPDDNEEVEVDSVMVGASIDQNSSHHLQQHQPQFTNRNRYGPDSEEDDDSDVLDKSTDEDDDDDDTSPLFSRGNR